MCKQIEYFLRSLSNWFIVLVSAQVNSTRKNVWFITRNGCGMLAGDLSPGISTCFKTAHQSLSKIKLVRCFPFYPPFWNGGFSWSTRLPHGDKVVDGEVSLC